MAVSKRLRYEILRRDNHACRYCGLGAPEVKLTVDHVVPTALGGSDEPSNLVAACKDCNAGKSASSPDATLVADVDAKAVRWSQAMSLAIEQRAAELAAERASTEPFDDAWSAWTVNGQLVPRDPNWKNSILRFLAGGLDDQFMDDAIHTAMGLDRIPASDKWRYFCGICWREMDTLREMAADHLEAPLAGSEAATANGVPWNDEEMLLSSADVVMQAVVIALGGSRQDRLYASDALRKGVPVARRVYAEQFDHTPGVDNFPAADAAWTALMAAITADLVWIQPPAEVTVPDGS